jgi:lysophospholipase
MQVTDRLFDHPESPIPPGADCGLIETADRVRLRWATFRSERRPHRGTVLLLQGRAEYVERWFETIRDLQARGFDVATFDWRGQGGSERPLRDARKGHVADFRRYGLDLDAVLARVLPTLPGPYWLLAHSTGGLVAITAEKRIRDVFGRAVLAAPFLGLGDFGLPEPAIRVLTRFFRDIGFGRAWIPGGGATAAHTRPLAGNRLTSDPIRHARGADFAWRHPDLAIGSPTLGWVAAAFAAFDRAFAESTLTDWRMPTLMVVGSADRVVSIRAIERFAATTRSTDLAIVPGARHELLSERDRYREPFWAAFDAFVPGGATAATTPTDGLDDTAPGGGPDDTAGPGAAPAIPLPAATDPSTAATSGEGEQAEHLVVQAAVAAGDDPTTLGGTAAGPGGDDAARPLDDRDQRHDVVGLQPGLDHQIDEAGGDHAVGVTVDPVARQPHP